MIWQRLPWLHRQPDADFFDLLKWVGLLTMAIGYLVTVVTSHHLAVWPFLLFTAINVTWLALCASLTAPDNQPESTSLKLAAMTALAVAALFCLPLGLGYDWLLPAVTTGIVALALHWRAAAAVIGIFVVASATSLLLASDVWGDIITTIAQALTAYVFVLIFSLVIRRQQQLREQAEELAAAVSHANQELERAHADLRARASQAEELTVSRERNRMAREIHDTLGHYLTILAVQLETAIKLEEYNDPQLKATLRDARRVAAECLAEVRRSVAALRPGDIAATSLAGALRRLVEESEALSPDTKITLDIEEPEPELEPELRAALYRSAQEALTNVRKHAQATKVLVRLRVDTPGHDDGQTGRVSELTVLDNGHSAGNAAAYGAQGFGLLGMSERIALLGGTATAGPEPGKGWRVEVRAPMVASGSAPRECPPPTSSSAVVSYSSAEG
jgi:signal transduction histidine kinase